MRIAIAVLILSVAAVYVANTKAQKQPSETPITFDHATPLRDISCWSANTQEFSCSMSPDGNLELMWNFNGYRVRPHSTAAAHRVLDAPNQP